MRVAYRKSERSRVSAWHHLLHARRPKITADTGDEVFHFEPGDGDFFKDHTEDEWAWCVRRYPLHGAFRETAPVGLESPEPVKSKGGVVNYCWQTWTDHKGETRCGFAAVTDHGLLV